MFSNICISLYDNEQDGVDLKRPLFVELFYETLRSEFGELLLNHHHSPPTIHAIPVYFNAIATATDIVAFLHVFLFDCATFTAT
jgi:hypothetical protein